MYPLSVFNSDTIPDNFKLNELSNRSVSILSDSPSIIFADLIYTKFLYVKSIFVSLSVFITPYLFSFWAI